MTLFFDQSFFPYFMVEWIIQFVLQSAISKIGIQIFEEYMFVSVYTEWDTTKYSFFYWRLWAIGDFTLDLALVNTKQRH